ncbi:MAG TPA: twin-arginine translocase TatA/TatE family subunit [Acidimicrobiales bacterium]|jgi:sec-independent protein translocase protein TatB
MLNLDPAKLLIIAVVVVILLGPDKLPQVARQVGGAWRSFNEFRHRMEADVRSSIPDLPSSTEIARLARSPSALLNHLSNMSPNGNANGNASSGTVGGREDGAGDTGVGVGVDSDPASDPAVGSGADGHTDGAGAGPDEPDRPAQVYAAGDPNLN